MDPRIREADANVSSVSFGYILSVQIARGGIVITLITYGNGMRVNPETQFVYRIRAYLNIVLLRDGDWRKIKVKLTQRRVRGTFSSEI